MRKRGKTDANQSAIVHDLRKIGCTVWVTSGCGQGAPDLVVGYRNNNYLFELKDPNQPASKQKLTEDEKAWHLCWSGRVDVIRTSKEAMAILR